MRLAEVIEPEVEPAAYEVEVDSVERDEWCEILTRFDDANLHQTWSYGACKWGEPNLSHLVLKREGRVVAAAQATLVRVPGLRWGVAFVQSAPLWRLRAEATPDRSVFRRVIAALRDHYSVERGLLLRVMTREVDAGDGWVRAALASEGLRPQAGLVPYRTFLVDLSPPLEELRGRMRKSWRRVLSRAERREELEVVQVEGDEGVEVFMRLYDEMQARKPFADFSDVRIFRRLQSDLPPNLQLEVVVGLDGGEPVAAMAMSVLGDTGFAMLGATGDGGLDIGASQRMDWWTIGRLKERGLRWYDLGGAGDPQVNLYKIGLVGREHPPVEFVGNYAACRSLGSLVTVRVGDGLKRAVRWAKKRSAARRSFRPEADPT